MLKEEVLYRKQNTHWKFTGKIQQHSSLVTAADYPSADILLHIMTPKCHFGIMISLSIHAVCLEIFWKTNCEISLEVPSFGR